MMSLKQTLFDFSRVMRNDKKLHPLGTIGHCGVVHNSKLEGENYGRIISSSFLFCTCRSSCTCKNGKINKNLERKRNPGSGLQGRVIHCCEQLSHCGVDRTVYKSNK